MQQRIEGYDLARALAVFGMVVVNFKLVMGAAEGSTVLGPWLSTSAGWLEGRAVATFVILAGVGVTLLSRRAVADGDPRSILRARLRLLRRAFLLVVVGLSYAPIWPADILHFYGLYFVAGALLLTASNRTLWIAAGGFVAGFVVLLMCFDYTTAWDFTTLEYADFWTAEGMVRHLFFNGFHPVFPWTAFLLVGMWLGRLPLADAAVRRRLGAWAALVWGLTELVSQGLVAYGLRTWTNLPADDVRALFGTEPMPPMPQYLLAGGGLAVVVIVVCLEVSQRWPESPWLRPFYATGKLSLTLYVAHVILGMGTLEALGRLHDQSIEVALFSALVFCCAGTLFATLWLRRFDSGPLEWVFRRLAG